MHRTTVSIPPQSYPTMWSFSTRCALSECHSQNIQLWSHLLLFVPRGVYPFTMARWWKMNKTRSVTFVQIKRLQNLVSDLSSGIKARSAEIVPLRHIYSGSPKGKLLNQSWNCVWRQQIRGLCCCRFFVNVPKRSELLCFYCSRLSVSPASRFRFSPVRFVEEVSVYYGGAVAMQPDVACLHHVRKFTCWSYFGNW